MEEMRILDSGERTEYETGAVRDIKAGKGRCDLMPLGEIADLYCESDENTADGFFRELSHFRHTGDRSYLYHAVLWLSHCHKKWDGNVSRMLLDISLHFEEGAEKYGPNNWQKGIPIHSYIDSAIRHYLKWAAGYEDEPHDRACVWNLLCCAWTMAHHPGMDDFTRRGKQQPETLRTAVDKYINAHQGEISLRRISEFQTMQKHHFERAMDMPLKLMNDSLWQSAIDLETQNYTPKTVINAWAKVKLVLKDIGIATPNVILPFELRRKSNAEEA